MVLVLCLAPSRLFTDRGKVAEHAIHNKVSRYLEEKDVYPHNMTGFRAGLSTQDAMRRIKDQAIDRNTRDMGATLDLDLEKAFDNILHSFVLGTISSLGLSKHFHDFKRSFLPDKKAILQVG
ncbi:uncharacterized protein [Dermacentor albipictus]|uniref:uncharacterized protein n=1 Tax=Dermacentor albipictus TaxID=60249 RepID=UPI0038FC5103